MSEPPTQMEDALETWYGVGGAVGYYSLGFMLSGRPSSHHPQLLCGSSTTEGCEVRVLFPGTWELLGWASL